MSGEAPTRETIVPFLAKIFERRGAEEYLGEPVTIAEHMLQGAKLAEDDGAEDALVAAALLHDIGHFTSEFGAYSPDDMEDKHHDEAGAEVLEPFFPPVVTECVRLHVAAKRFLCATDPSYFSKAVVRVGAYAFPAGWADERRGGGGVQEKSVPRRGRARAALGRGRQSAGDEDPIVPRV
jgi:hypothetical protein